MNRKRKIRAGSSKRIISIAAVVLTALIVVCVGVGAGIHAKYARQVGVSGSIAIDSTLGGIAVQETEPDYSNGQYYFNRSAGDVTTTFDYYLVPGSDIACDAYVLVTDKTEVPAYVYVEINDKLVNGSFSISDNWLETGFTGAHEGTVYVYTAGTEEAVTVYLGDGRTSERGELIIPIIEDDLIDVTANANAEADDNTTDSFWAYMIVSGEAEYDTAFTEYTGIEPSVIIISDDPDDPDEPDDPDDPIPAAGSRLGVTSGALVNTFHVYTTVDYAPVAVVGSGNSVSVTVPARQYPVFVRAYYTVNWVDASGNVYGVPPVAGTDYTITFPNGSTWFTDDYGICYYPTAVNASDSSVSIPLIASVSLNEGVAAPDGYTLKVQAVAQVIQAIGYTEDGVPVVTAEWHMAYRPDPLSISLPTP